MMRFLALLLVWAMAYTVFTGLGYQLHGPTLVFLIGMAWLTNAIFGR